MRDVFRRLRGRRPIEKLFRTGVFILALFVPAAAAAQELCTLPERLPAAHARTPDWRNTTARTDYFAFVLSWSPEYCAGRERQPADRVQCSLNRFGFVVHGLWPNAARADGVRDHPRHCRVPGPLPADVVRRYICMMPSVELMQNEWQAHGTCAFETPGEYFNRTAVLWSRFAQPDLAALARTGAPVTVGAVKDAIIAANPGQGLARPALAVSLADGGWLREVTICYGKEWRPVRCPMPGAPDRRPAQVRR